MALLTLPPGYELLQSTKPYLDVIGPHAPWEMPSGWAEHVAERVEALALAGGDTVLNVSAFVPNTPAIVQFIKSAATWLADWSTVFTGEHGLWPWHLVEKYITPGSMPAPSVSQRYVPSNVSWPLLPLDWAISQGASADRREAVLRASIEAVELFADVPMFAARRTVLLGLLRHAVEDPAGRALHLEAPWAQIAAHWRNDLDPAVYHELPELSGWRDAVTWSLEGLSAVHELIRPGSGWDRTFADVVAGFALHAERTELPAMLSACLSADDFAAVSASFQRQKPGFDSDVQVRRHREWIVQRLGSGELELVRTWMAFASQVSVGVAGLPEAPKHAPGAGTNWLVMDIEEMYTPARGTNPHVARLAALRPIAAATPAANGANAPGALEGVGAGMPLAMTSGGDDSAPQMPEDDVEIGDPQGDLEALIGLGPIKEQVKRLSAEARAEIMRRNAGMPDSGRSRHLVFTGNPGTAKTTVARIVARVYAQLGLLGRGHLVEASREDLIGEFIGQTAPKVRKLFERAVGGVLFIDEAYALIPKDSHRDFGHEAVATLIKLMEDRRDDVVVIVAGYPDEMARFLESNPGVASRFPRTLAFADYSDADLWAIFQLVTDQAGFVLGPGVQQAFHRLLPHPRPAGFGNGRYARNVFEEATARQAERIVSLATATNEDVRSLHVSDMPIELAPVDNRPAPGMYL